MAFALPPELLASAADITLPNLVAAQDRLAEEAREVLPYSFDECTFSKGSIRQSVWSCLDCGEKGVCYGCSISCHSEHRLVELWTKRAFTCDCPTSAMCTPSSSSSSKRRCKLNPPEQQPQPPNESNASRYTQNFAGKFCRCGRDYDPETESEAMMNCMGCEDWFHESCLNLAPRKPEREVPLEEDEEESDSLIPSEKYDGLICAKCAEYPFIAERKGTEGWMVIVPSPSGGWCVEGGKGLELTKEVVKEGTKKETEVEGMEARTKRVADDDGPTPKRVKLGEDAPVEPSVPAMDKPEAEEDKPVLEAVSAMNPEGAAANAVAEATAPPAVEVQPDLPRIAAGDVFLAHGVREHLKATLSDEVASSLPFPLVDEEIYEPPPDTDEPETLEQVTQRAVAGLPRVQAIEALHGYESMKDNLKAMLQTHVASGESVSKQDIESFFETLRANRAK